MQEITQEQIDEWEAVTRENDGGAKYAQAQTYLGIYHAEQDDFQGACNHLNNIYSSDDINLYSKAQFNLGKIIFNKKNDLDNALKHWSNVSKNNSPLGYALLQLNLGNIYASQQNSFKACEHWLKVLKEDNSKCYAEAQFKLGLYEFDHDEIEKAIGYWSNINKADDVEMYAMAQMNLGLIFLKKSQIDKSNIYFNNILEEDDAELYQQAQSHLSFEYLQKGEITEFRNRFSKSNLKSVKLHHNQSCFLQISRLNISDEHFESMLYVFSKVSEILKSLFVKPNQDDSKVAHYTRAQVAHLMLKKPQDASKTVSPFRMTTIQDVNDPTEGSVLFDYLNMNSAQSNHSELDCHAFIACFSFNHDWLNQFRLYGKDKNQEASGVSLVFDQSFFAARTDIASPIGNISFANQPSTQPINALTNNVEEKKSISPLALYRCIYCDPQTGLIKLARREEWSFYRQEYSNSQATTDSKERWKKYSDEIVVKEDAVVNELNELKELIADLLQYYSEDKEFLKILDMVLLPLRYLVKHMAFREEQECRIYHVTNLNDSVVQDDFDKKWLFVDYQVIDKYLDKIYLAPETSSHQNFFIRALGDRAKDAQGRSRVKLSQNPFRNPVRT